MAENIPTFQKKRRVQMVTQGIKRLDNTEFIVIDDDPMNNRICEIVIIRNFPENNIKMFTDAQEGIDYIAKACSATDTKNVILFLDLKMPKLDGWAVLEKIALIPDAARLKLNVYILSSSTDQKDIKRAKANPIVKKFINKPLLINSLSQQIHNTDFFSGSTPLSYI